MPTVDKWNYKGYRCIIKEETEYDEDGNVENLKFYHYVQLPNGDILSGDLDPYDNSRILVEAWVDRGCPTNKYGRNFFKEDLLMFHKNVLLEDLNNIKFDENELLVGKPKTTKEQPSWKLEQDGYVGLYYYNKGSG